MIFGLSAVQLSLGTAGLAAVVLLVGAVASGREETEPDLATTDGVVKVDELEDDPDQVVSLPEPDLRKSRFGLLGQYIAYKRYKRKQRKLAKKGYVRWYLIDGVFPRAKFVRPDYSEGGDIPTLDYDGGSYLFPQRAAVPGTKSGMWTVVHRRGEAEPINLRDPNREALSAKAVDEALGMWVSASAPSIFDRFGDLDPKTIMAAAIGVVIVLSVVGGWF